MISCISVSHRTAGFDFLEKLSLGTPAVLPALGASPQVSGAVVLSTCNRFEVYVDSRLPDALPVLAEATGVRLDALREHARVLNDESATHHLFSVAAGLDSVIVGEEEISGQVSRAFTAARDAGHTSTALEGLFQAAAHTSRDVKTRTALSSAGRSLVRLALELASSRFADWLTLRVLLVGTGRYAATTVAALRSRGVEDIAVFSASGRGQSFATSHALRVATELRTELASADVVIACTAAEEYVISGADVVQNPPAGDAQESAQSSISGGSSLQLIIDLGLPRNVNPDVADIAGIELLDLETISLHAPLEELSSASDAREIVATAAAAYLAEASVAPAVVALREHVLGTLATEIERRGVSVETAAALRHFAGVLLHSPSVRARELALNGRTKDFVDGLDALFGIRPLEDAGTGRDSEPDLARSELRPETRPARDQAECA